MTAPTPDRSPVAPASVGEQIAALAFDTTEHVDSMAGQWKRGYNKGIEDAVEVALAVTSTVDDAAVDEAAGSWICGRCGDAPEGHTDANSKCVYDPTFRRSAIAIPRQNSLSGRAGEWFKAFATVPTSPTEAAEGPVFDCENECYKRTDNPNELCPKHATEFRQWQSDRKPTAPTVTPAATDDDNGLRAAVSIIDQMLEQDWSEVGRYALRAARRKIAAHSATGGVE